MSRDLTLRDQLALAAMSGLSSNENITLPDIARMAYETADWALYFRDFHANVREMLPKEREQ